MSRTPRGALRRTLSVALITAACALLPVATVAAWARVELADADAYTAAMAPVATAPGVRAALADAVADGVLRQVDRGAPPLDRDALRESAVRGFVRDAVGSFTATDAYQDGWDTAHRTAHGVVMDAVRDPGGERVTVDLAPVTERVRQRLVEDGVTLARRIPVQPTVVTVLPGEDPRRLREGVHMLELAGLWLPVGSVALALGGILFATVRRRAVTATALGAAGAAGALSVAIAVCRELTLGDLPPHVSRAAAGAVFDALTGSLRTAAWVVLALGLVVGLTGWAAGRFAGVRGARAASAPRPSGAGTGVGSGAVAQVGGAVPQVGPGAGAGGARGIVTVTGAVPLAFTALARPVAAAPVTTPGVVPATAPVAAPSAGPATAPAVGPPTTGPAGPAVTGPAVSRTTGPAAGLAPSRATVAEGRPSSREDVDGP
ncbi:hypothetical protein JNUCC64_17895 [Streptomyces sp. JNUCC 64]